MIPLIDLSSQYDSIKNEINQAVLEVLKDGQYIMGRRVKEFEEKMSVYTGAKHAVSCANGTDALILSLQALGIGAGDEVITTPFTFFATAEAISRAGATPVFVDVQPDTFNINPDLIEKKVSKKTKAVVPVHIFGQPADMDAINELAGKYNLIVIEDACQAVGAEYKGRRAGSLGDAACFSFFPTKNLGAYGDAGMVTTNDDRTATLIRALRAHGSGSPGLKALNSLQDANTANQEGVPEDHLEYGGGKYFNYLIGYNSRLDEIQAAVLLTKLKYIDKWNDSRRETADYYKRRLQGTGLKLPEVIGQAKSVFHMYVLQSENRNELMQYLKQKGISTGIYYPVPLHLQKAYQNLGYRYGDLPVSEYLSHRTLAIPVYAELTFEQKRYIADSILEFMI